MKYEHVKEYFKEVDPEDVSFDAFLRRVKYAFKKVLGCESVQTDEFSLVPDARKDSRTLWERIRQDGGCQYNAPGIAIDVDYDRVIYVSTWEEGGHHE